MQPFSGPANPLATLWKKHPRALGALTGVSLVLGLFANPLVLRLIGLSLNSQPIPKSGFWLLFVSFSLFALTLLAAQWSDQAAGLFLSVLIGAGVLFPIDLGLRLFPPVEVTGAQPPPREIPSNSWGLRGPEPRPSAGRWILALGDSITFGVGDGLTDRNRYHDLVAERLRGGDWDLDLQNVSYPQWGFNDYLRQYEAFSPRLTPQMVIVGWCMNDINYGKVAEALPNNVETRVTGSTWRVSALRAWIKPLAQKLRVNEWLLHTVLSKRISLKLRELGWIEQDWLEVHQYLDLYATFLAGQGQQELYSFRDDCHPNARGHELVAESLVAEVKRTFPGPADGRGGVRADVGQVPHQESLASPVSIP